MEDTPQVVLDEQVVLSKFEGDPTPENEFERVTISNGTVVAHEKVENGEVTGPVEDSDILGASIGTLSSPDTDKEEN